MSATGLRFAVFLLFLTALLRIAMAGEPPSTAPATQAIEKAEGFGGLTKGGEGGRVLEVTNLADSGKGSLREALGTKGPRIVRFGVEGTIELQSRLRVTEGRLTIDASSAEIKGITLMNHGIQFVDCQDVIVRHLRIRVTTGGTSGDAILLWGKAAKVNNVLIDHCSLMGATDENVNTWGEVENVTFQWCLIARGRPPHSKAWLSGVGSTRVTIHHCLISNCDDRNPKLEGGRYDLANNVIANWANNNATKVRSGVQVNIVNNVFIPGSASRADKGCVFLEDPAKDVKLFVNGNLSPLTPPGTEKPWSLVTLNEQADGRKTLQPAPETYRAPEPFHSPAVTTQPADQACELVIDRAGARVRDKDDQEVIKEVRRGWAALKKTWEPASGKSGGNWPEK